MARVAVVGPIAPDTFADNVVDTLRSLGHEVFALGAARPKVAGRRLNGLLDVVAEHDSSLDSLRQRRLSRVVAKVRPELLISVDRRLHYRVLEAVRECGGRSCLWFPDAVSSLHRGDLLLAGYDVVYLKNPLWVERARMVLGMDVRYLPEAANPSWHHPIGEYGLVNEVAVAGNIHPARAILVDHLIEMGFPVRIYGAAIPKWIRRPHLDRYHSGTYLAREEKARAFRRARVVLNNLHPAEYAGVNCRLFEAAASGGLVFMEPNAGLGDLFEVGEEVVTYESLDELAAKLRYYLASPSRGVAIADAAAKRAARDHSYAQRLARLLADFGL